MAISGHGQEASFNTFERSNSVYGLERLRRSNPYTLLLLSKVLKLASILEEQMQSRLDLAIDFIDCQVQSALHLLF
jgi:hypothetical protein